jgi:hypothetical protein
MEPITTCHWHLKSVQLLENPVDLATDPVVMIWHARNILADIEEVSEIYEISKRLSEIETTLFDLILRMIVLRKERDKPRLHLILPPAG